MMDTYDFKYAFSDEKTEEILLHLLKKPFYTKNIEEYKIYKSLIKSLNKFKQDKTGAYTDYDIYLHIHDFMNLNYYKVFIYPENESYARSIRRANDVKTIYKYALANKIPAKYLDIGCSTGLITKLIIEKLHIPPHSTYAIDIIDFDSSVINYKKVEKENELLPYDNESFNLITCIMSLHHIPKYEKYIEEMYRCLRPNGIVIIQEHNVDTISEKRMLNILHGLYSISWCKTGNQENPNFCSEQTANYLSKKDLKLLFLKIGFKKIQIPKIKYESIPWHNTFKNYWAVFQKPIQTL